MKWGDPIPPGICKDVKGKRLLEAAFVSVQKKEGQFLGRRAVNSRGMVGDTPAVLRERVDSADCKRVVKYSWYKERQKNACGGS
jgi:hypothetical protein